jgi:hypothetical protein
MDFAAEQISEFAADRQPKTGPAIFATCTGVGLLERLEDDFLFLDRNTDTGIGDLEGDYRRRISGW